MTSARAILASALRRLEKLERDMAVDLADAAPQALFVEIDGIRSDLGELLAVEAARRQREAV